MNPIRNTSTVRNPMHTSPLSLLLRRGLSLQLAVLIHRTVRQEPLTFKDEGRSRI